MRIRHIRLKNLTSLVGEWEIDLMDPRFRSAGIFALTGPTGAGKTTVLDAICLALFGRTPRLGKPSIRSNEILSRHTGSCHAEVTFDTPKGRFRAHWSQRRARGKPMGKLQAPRHEIAHADSGALIATKQQEVADAVERLTGMDFNRFTRAILLAQGEFAAFLKATPNERAPILEQITGTAIYSRISVRVHERKTEAEKKRALLSAELAAIQPLTEEEEVQLNLTLADKQAQETQRVVQIDHHKKAMDWLDRVTALEQGLLQLTQEEQAWHARHEAFAADRRTLQRATQALELAGIHAELTALRTAQQADQRAYEHHTQARPPCTEALQTAQERLQRAERTLEQAKQSRQQTTEIIQTTRQQDVTLREINVRIEECETRIRGRAADYDELQAKQEKARRQRDTTQTERTTVTHLLTDTAVDATLVENLAALRNRFDTLKTAYARCHQAHAATQTDEQAHLDQIKRWHEQRDLLEKQQHTLTQLQAQVAQATLQGPIALDAADPGALRQQVVACQDRARWLDALHEAVIRWTSLREERVRSDRRQATLATERAALLDATARQAERCDALEREQALLETQRALLEKIQSFETARKHLRPAEPCPLCGATAHPFVHQESPTPPDQTREALHALRRTLKTAQDHGVELAKQQVALDKDQEQLATRRQEKGEEQEATLARIQTLCRQLAWEAPPDTLAEPLPAMQSENAARLADLDRRVHAVEAAEARLTHLNQAMDRFRHTQNGAEQAVQEARHAVALADQAWTKSRETAQEAQDLLKTTQTELQHQVACYGVPPLTMDNLDRVQGVLTARHDLWVQRKAQQQALAGDLATLEAGMQQRRQTLQEIETAQAQDRNRLADLQRREKTRQQARHALFADKNPDREEEALARAVDAAEEARRTAYTTRERAAQACDRLLDTLKGLKEAMASRTDPLHAGERRFHDQLAEHSFRDEEDYQAALRPQERRDALERQARALQEEQTGLQSRRRDMEARLASERHTPLTDQPRTTLAHAMATLIPDQQALQREIGAIQQRVRDNNTRKQDQQHRLDALAVQAQAAQRWQTLHDLIGSSDGRTYRNFAQGLTFETVIGHANRQLRKMSDRYLLTRDQTRPLMLNVIDDYQAGEVRSTENLSGGESFIVSLALALGLSCMVSHTIRVDSLFLDEGFGTLDAEALETALETLAGLQQDGKMIGIISHVGTLEERMDVRIQVIPETGGRSVLRGPGCRQRQDRPIMTLT